MTSFITKAKALSGYTQTLRRDFHHHPKFDFDEKALPRARLP